MSSKAVGAAPAVASVSTLRCPRGKAGPPGPHPVLNEASPPPPSPASTALGTSAGQPRVLGATAELLGQTAQPDHSNPPRRLPALFTGPTPELLPDPISRGQSPRAAVAAPFYLAPDGSPEWAGWAQPGWTPPSSFQRALTLHGVSLLRFPNDHKTELQVQGAVKLQGSVQKHGPQPGPRGRHLWSACSPAGSGTAAPLPTRRDFMHGGGGGRQEEQGGRRHSSEGPGSEPMGTWKAHGVPVRPPPARRPNRG